MRMKPARVRRSCRRVGDHARDLDDLADGGDREPAAKQVGNRELE
jgi:hypothetical protein